MTDLGKSDLRACRGRGRAQPGHWETAPSRAMGAASEQSKEDADGLRDGGGGGGWKSRYRVGGTRKDIKKYTPRSSHHVGNKSN